MTSYRTFWIVCGLYFLTLAFTTASGMEFLKWIAAKGAQFGTVINIERIPLYHFPDVWQNLIYISGLFKIVLAIMVVISITNEFTYRTIRQNIIDGMSRWQFLQSKIMTNVLLALMSMTMVFFIGLVTGIIYSPSIELTDVFTTLSFFPRTCLRFLPSFPMHLCSAYSFSDQGLRSLFCWFLIWLKPSSR